MTRLSVHLLLVLALLASALYLVRVQYESRRLYSALDRARSEARVLAQDNERLQVEKRAQATSARVEALAKTKLQMRAANPAITAYVAYTPDAARTPAADALAQRGEPERTRTP